MLVLAIHFPCHVCFILVLSKFFSNSNPAVVKVMSLVDRRLKALLQGLSEGKSCYACRYYMEHSRGNINSNSERQSTERDYLH